MNPEVYFVLRLTVRISRFILPPFIILALAKGNFGVLAVILLLEVLTPRVSDIQVGFMNHLSQFRSPRSLGAMGIVIAIGIVSGHFGLHDLVMTFSAHSFATTMTAGLCLVLPLSAWFMMALYKPSAMRQVFDPPTEKASFEAMGRGIWKFMVGGDARPAHSAPVAQEQASWAVWRGPAETIMAPINKQVAEMIAHIQTNTVIGQDAIVADALSTISRRIIMQRTNKPLAVFLFVGATGSGKTELAKAIAKVVFGGRIFRVDCNEMTESHCAQRLIGSPQGYVDSEHGGQLTNAIMAQGTGVLLFDEIEKAHDAVTKLIMGLMDEGRITEQRSGHAVDASGHVIILTSNAAHEQIAQLVRDVENEADRRRQVKDALSSVFRPEQLARIDEIYAFGELDRRSLVKIVAKALTEMSASAGVELIKVDTALIVESIVQHERMAKYGIRELLRAMEKRLVDSLYSCKAAGFKQVEIKVTDGELSVRGVSQ